METLETFVALGRVAREWVTEGKATMRAAGWKVDMAVSEVIEMLVSTG